MFIYAIYIYIYIYILSLTDCFVVSQLISMARQYIYIYIYILYTHMPVYVTVYKQ